MRLEIRAHEIELDKSLKSHLDRRLRFAFTRFGRRLRRVSVGLRDVNGPRGGADILCTIRVELSPWGEIVIRDTGTDAFAAVSRAVDRASRSIAWHPGRFQGRRKRGSVRNDRQETFEPTGNAAIG